MLRRLLIGLVAVVAVVAVALAVRSWRTDETDRARAAVERFAAAVEDRNYRLVCDGLLDARLRDRLEAVELPCVEALRIGLGDVRDPRLTVENVVVVDGRARAAVRTAAAGQPASQDVLSLVRQDGTWRISSLANENAGGAVPGGAPRGADGAAGGDGTAGETGTVTGPAPPETVITTPTPAADGALTPRTSGLPHDEPLTADEPAGATAAERRRARERRAEQRRAQRAQGERGQ